MSFFKKIVDWFIQDDPYEQRSSSAYATVDVPQLITPKELPEPSFKHPRPWTAQHRNDGTFNVFDANGIIVARVMCSSLVDEDVLNRVLRATL